MAAGETGHGHGDARRALTGVEAIGAPAGAGGGAGNDDHGRALERAGDGGGRGAGAWVAWPGTHAGCGQRGVTAVEARSDGERRWGETLREGRGEGEGGGSLGPAGVRE